MKSEGLTLRLDGVDYDEAWTEAEVTRDLKDFAGTFSFTLRDATRSIATFDYASPTAALYRTKTGQFAEIFADGELVLVGYVKDVETNIDDMHAEVTISGEDKAGDLVDCAAAPNGPGELKNVRLEDVTARIAKPFGLRVRNEIDTGRPFPRYALDLAEFGYAAIEKGARQRHALVMSDGIGGIVITRTGKNRAPAGLELPGNVLGASAKSSHKDRHSETIVRGRQEKAGKLRDDKAAPLTPDTAPPAPDARPTTDGSATDRERRGTAVTGRAVDPEIRRYRPIVHLARTQADKQDAGDEADWRMRTSRAESEEANYRVQGFRANGQLWRVNEMTYVSDAFSGIERDLLISRTAMRESDQSGRETELTVTSPEAFDKGETGSRRTNQKRRSKGPQKGLDGKAEAL